MKSATRFYTAFSGIFLLLQGISTLTFRLFPALDNAFPALLSITQMVPIHSTLHILTGLAALLVLVRGGERGAFWFAAGFGAFYTALAMFGMITHHPTILRLQAFDHPFHLLLGAWGLLVAGLYLYRSQSRKAASL
ncbi:MAG TPA: DUF4383 domain-containing protein [Anaerolineales bacterium]|nr:DUF4383 domain-containing protein [Anaerolineales bacterium]